MNGRNMGQSSTLKEDILLNECSIDCKQRPAPSPST